VKNNDHVKSFYVLAAECIFHWNQWFGIDPKNNSTTTYKTTFDKCIGKVQFPTAFTFFKKEEDKKKFNSSASNVSSKSQNKPKNE